MATYTGLDGDTSNEMVIVGGGFAVRTKSDQPLSITDDDEGNTGRMSLRSNNGSAGDLSMSATISGLFPAGNGTSDAALVVGAGFNVETTITASMCGASWSATLGCGGSTIVTGIGFSQDTKANGVPGTAIEEIAAATDCVFSPNCGSFTAGAIEAVAWYMDFTDLANV